MIVSLVVITLLFAMIYKVLPDVKLAWRDVWVGALVTAGLFTIGKFLIGLYIGTSAFASTYGAAGSVLVVLLWVYYSSQVILLGRRVYPGLRGTVRTQATAGAVCHQGPEAQDDARGSYRWVRPMSFSPSGAR